RADGGRDQVRGGRDPRTRTRSARISVEDERVATGAGPAAPAARRMEGAEVRPLAQVRLPEEDGARLAELGGDGRVLERGRPDERKGSRRGLHPVARVDVVLQQDRDPMERPADVAIPAFAVQSARDV